MGHLIPRHIDCFISSPLTISNEKLSPSYFNDLDHILKSNWFINHSLVTSNRTVEASVTTLKDYLLACLNHSISIVDSKINVHDWASLCLVTNKLLLESYNELSNIGTVSRSKLECVTFEVIPHWMSFLSEISSNYTYLITDSESRIDFSLLSAVFQMISHQSSATSLCSHCRSSPLSLLAKSCSHLSAVYLAETKPAPSPLEQWVQLPFLQRMNPESFNDDHFGPLLTSSSSPNKNEARSERSSLSFNLHQSIQRSLFESKQLSQQGFLFRSFLQSKTH